MSDVLTVSTPMPPWFDPELDDPETAVLALVELATGRDTQSATLRDIVDTLDGSVWTWTVHIA